MAPAESREMVCGKAMSPPPTAHPLCSANKAPADKLEEALVSDEGNPKDGNTTTLTTAHCSAFPAGQPSLPRDRAGVFQQSILLHTHRDHRAVAGSGACPGECE